MICKELSELNNKPVKKLAKDTSRYSQMMANRHEKKMLRVISHQGSATKNHYEISPKPKNQNAIYVAKDMGQGTLLHRWWEYKLVQPLQRTTWRLLRCLKTYLPYDQSSHSWEFIWNEISMRDFLQPPMFTAAQFTLPLCGANPDAQHLVTE